MDRTTALKAAIVGTLALALLVPVSMIRDLIAERQARRNEAVAGIALGWGQRQTLAGPYLYVPYEHAWTEVTQEIVDGRTHERRLERRESGLVRLPADKVHWAVDATTSERARGIYKARLYFARVRAEGLLRVPANFSLAQRKGRTEWGAPFLVLGVSGPRGIRSVGALSIGTQSSGFVPGAGDAALPAGIHAPLELPSPAKTQALEFSFALELAGAEALAIAPLARDTSVAIRADWPHPSYRGVFLPASHEISADGFDARWQVSRYAAQGAERLAACGGAKPCSQLLAQTLEVSFIEQAGLYQRLERASKYGFLFIGLTFAAFGAVLAALDGALYMLLQAEDYALLAGSLLLFGLLAAVMIATRSVDWYRLARAGGGV